MATLQKFKILATQCAVVAGSPTLSPTASPVIHLRRRKTLRMFLTRPDRRRFPRRCTSPDSPPDDNEDGIGDRNNDPPPPEKSTEARVRRKLKDLFVSSPSPPPMEERIGREVAGDEAADERGLLLSAAATDGFARTRRGGGGSLSIRPLTASLRCRLLKRAWRPVLVSIPE